MSHTRASALSKPSIEKVTACNPARAQQPTSRMATQQYETSATHSMSWLCEQQVSAVSKQLVPSHVIPYCKASLQCSLSKDTSCHQHMGMSGRCHYYSVTCRCHHYSVTCRCLHYSVTCRCYHDQQHVYNCCCPLDARGTPCSLLTPSNSWCCSANACGTHAVTSGQLLLGVGPACRGRAQHASTFNRSSSMGAQPSFEK
jgi:hypothetical protein